MRIKLGPVYKVENIRPRIHWVLNQTSTAVNTATAPGATTAAVIINIIIIPIVTSHGILQLQNALILPSYTLP